jgi:hypothetical protein
MLFAQTPRLSWSFGAPQDLSFLWATPEPAPVTATPAFTPPALAMPGLIAPLPPAGQEALPPLAPVTLAPPPVERPALPEPPAAAEPALTLPLPPADTLAAPPPALEPPITPPVIPPITPPGPHPLAPDPAAWLDALWAARPDLPEIPAPPPPPPLAWFM